MQRIFSSTSGQGEKAPPSKTEAGHPASSYDLSSGARPENVRLSPRFVEDQKSSHEKNQIPHPETVGAAPGYLAALRTQSVVKKLFHWLTTYL